jgi:hypothetical protein
LRFFIARRTGAHNSLLVGLLKFHINKVYPGSDSSCDFAGAAESLDEALSKAEAFQCHCRIDEWGNGGRVSSWSNKTGKWRKVELRQLSWGKAPVEVVID